MMTSEAPSMASILRDVSATLEYEARMREILRDDEVTGTAAHRQALEWVEAHHDGCELDDLPGMFDDVLSIEVNATRSLGQGEWNLSSVDVHLAAGGPGYWIEYDGRNATLKGAWWGDTAERTLSHLVAAELDYLWECAENY